MVAGNRDTLLESGGNDVLTGGIGNDVIYGGAGLDTIWGKGGSDYIVGGAGIDTIKYTANNTTDDGHDVIAGFVAGVAGDVLNITDMADNAMDGTWITAHTSKMGNDTVLTLNAGESIVLVGIDPANLTADNFLGT